MQAYYFIHIALAYISLLLLLSRGILAFRRLDWRQYKLLNFLPHVVDTFLLVSGVLLFGWFGHSFSSWIFAKVLFLVLYVIFATKAFRKTGLFSIRHFVLAVVSFMMILLVATVK